MTFRRGDFCNAVHDRVAPMSTRKTIRTPVHGMLDARRTAGRDAFDADESLPSSQFEALRPRPFDVRRAIQDARDAVRRQERG
jgi:hypothetical protein